LISINHKRQFKVEPLLGCRITNLKHFLATWKIETPGKVREFGMAGKSQGIWYGREKSGNFTHDQGICSV